MLAKLHPYLKALFGAALAAYSSLQGTYVTDGHITWDSGFVALGAGLATLAIVWGVPNLTGTTPTK